CPGGALCTDVQERRAEAGELDTNRASCVIRGMLPQNRILAVRLTSHSEVMDIMKRRSFLNTAAAIGGGAIAAGSGMNLFGVAEQALAAHTGRSLSALRCKVIVKTVNSGFWQVVLAGAKKAVADMGITGLGFTGGPSEADIAAELSLIEDAIVQKPDYL